jgi:YHS domain-containing protein
MKRQILAAVFAGSLVSVPAPAQQPAGPQQALDGVDPVVLLQQGKEIIGKPEFAVTRGAFEYQFASAESKAAFEREPAKYEIRLNGSCARMGPGVTGNPSDYAVVDGKIYIFGSDDCHKTFVAAPAKFLPRDAPAMPSAAKDLERGRALVDRAAQALGGAAEVDAVTAYAETSTQIQKRPTGDVRVITTTTWLFPVRIRSERAMTLQGKTNTSTNLLTPEGGWFIGMNDRVYPQNPIAQSTSRQEFGRQLLPLLRTRRDAAFKAAAVANATIDGTPVERVRIQNGVVDVTLGIEPTSGRVHSLEFTGRNMDAEIGTYTLVFGDYRQVSGLTLPFEVRAFFDGTADSYRSATLDAIAINPRVDPALFAPPRADAK